MVSFQVEFTRDVLRSLVGQGLREVSYLYSGGSTPPDVGGRLHETPYGLRLVTSRSVPTTLTWLMEDECEALVAVEGSGEDVGITDLIEAYDVSASASWRPLLGRVITKAGMSWHRAAPGCPPMPWACRLEFGSSGAFVAVLAETCGETLQYQPDNVAVLFERGEAEALYWSGSDHSAWGGDIWPRSSVNC